MRDAAAGNVECLDAFINGTRPVERTGRNLQIGLDTPRFEPSSRGTFPGRVGMTRIGRPT